MKVRAFRDFISPVFGNISAGDIVEMDESTAKKWVEYQMGEIVGQPLCINADQEQKKPQPEKLHTSALQAAQALQKKILKNPKSGETKIKKKKSGQI